MTESALAIKKFFGFSSMKEFKEEWKKLSDKEKEYVRKTIAKILKD